MGKVTFLFPGQGSQEVGMGQDLFSKDDYFLSLVDEASKLVGEDLKKICQKGPEKKLAKATFVQPLIVAVSLGYLRHIQQIKICPDYVLGHSLGEITALAAAGVINDREAIQFAAKRGQLMDQAAAECDGSMMAVLSITAEKIKEIINVLALEETIFIANFNAPFQNVVSGSQKSLDILALEVFNVGGRCKRLNVSGPWHSPYLQSAHDQFKIWVESFVFSDPAVPVILNSTGKLESDPKKIKASITATLMNSVNFSECLSYCKDQDADIFLEIGPGRVLSGLLRINGFAEKTRIYNCNNLRGVDLARADFLSRSG